MKLMKYAFLALAGLFVAMIFGIGIYCALTFKPGAALTMTALFPIYFGIMMLSGLVVCCTALITEELKELRGEPEDEEAESEGEDGAPTEKPKGKFSLGFLKGRAPKDKAKDKNKDEE